MADYKDQLRKEIEDASNENEELIEIFLDKSRPVKERLDAFEKAGTFNQEDHVKKALAIMRNASENEEIRAAQRLPGVGYEHDGYLPD